MGRDGTQAFNDLTELQQAAVMDYVDSRLEETTTSGPTFSKERFVEGLRGHIAVHPDMVERYTEEYKRKLESQHNLDPGDNLGPSIAG